MGNNTYELHIQSINLLAQSLVKGYYHKRRSHQNEVAHITIVSSWDIQSGGCSTSPEFYITNSAPSQLGIRYIRRHDECPRGFSISWHAVSRTLF